MKYNNFLFNIFKFLKQKLKMLKWNKLDTYIFKSFLFSLFGSLFLFIVIYEIVQVFQDLRWIPHDADSKLLFLHYFYNGLYWMFIFVPFSFLFSSVFVLSKLAYNWELTAIISSGTSIYRATFYILLFSIISYFIMVFYLEDKLIFISYQKYFILRKIIFSKMDPEVLERLKDNRNFSIFGNNNLLYICEYYEAIGEYLSNITIIQYYNESSNFISKNKDLFGIRMNLSNKWLLTNLSYEIKTRNLEFFDKNLIKLRIDAEKAIWNSKTKKWIFYNGVIRKYDRNKENFIVENFNKRYFDFIADPPYLFEKVWYPVDAMTIKETKKYIEKLIRAREDVNDAKAKYFSKFSYPIGIIFVVLVAIGIVDISKRKSSIIINLVISLFLFTVYYLFFAVGLSLAGKGDLSPEIGSFMGTVFFGIISIYFYLRAKT